MNIQEIYKKFEIPPNLAEHMLSVTKVVYKIKEYWIGERVDWDFVKKSALLHDIGNIVKFKFDLIPEFMGDKATNIEHWREVQKRVIKKYGADDYIASGNILKEICITGDLWDVIQNKSFSNAVEVAESNDWYAKILLYADMRVMPFGVATLEERLSDVRNRMPQYTNRPDFEDLLNAARDIERQIADKLNAKINDIDWSKVAVSDSELLATDI